MPCCSCCRKRICCSKPCLQISVLPVMNYYSSVPILFYTGESLLLLAEKQKLSMWLPPQHCNKFYCWQPKTPACLGRKVTYLFYVGLWLLIFELSFVLKLNDPIRKLFWLIKLAGSVSAKHEHVPALFELQEMLPYEAGTLVEMKRAASAFMPWNCCCVCVYKVYIFCTLTLKPSLQSTRNSCFVFRWIITAGHCFVPTEVMLSDWSNFRTDLTKFKVILGMHYRGHPSTNYPPFSIERIVIYPR